MIKLFLFAAGLSLLLSTPAQPQRAAIELDPQDAIITYLTPYDNGRAEMQALAMINGAHHSIKVCAYGFTDEDICLALINAKERGVDVQVVMDSTQAAGTYQKPLVARLRRHEIPVTVGKSAVSSQLIHAKFMVVDDAIVQSGSWNYSGETANAQDNVVDFIVSDKRAVYFVKFWQMIHDHIKDRQGE